MKNFLTMLAMVAVLVYSHYSTYHDGVAEGRRLELAEQQRIDELCPPIVIEMGEHVATLSTPDLQEEKPKAEEEIKLWKPLDLDEVFRRQNEPVIRSMFDPKYKPDPEIKRLPPVEETKKPRKQDRWCGPVENLC